MEGWHEETVLRGQPYLRRGRLQAQAEGDPMFRGLEEENLGKVLLTSILLQLISRDKQLG